MAIVDSRIDSELARTVDRRKHRPPYVIGAAGPPVISSEYSRTLHLHISGGLRPSRRAVLAEYRGFDLPSVLRRLKKMMFFNDLRLNQDERTITRPSSWVPKYNRSEN